MNVSGDTILMLVGAINMKTFVVVDQVLSIMWTQGVKQTFSVKDQVVNI